MLPDSPERREPQSAGSDAPHFHLDPPGFESKLDYKRAAAGVFAGAAILAILAVSFTDVSALLLPMEERYLQVLIPRSPDGAEPFILEELSHELDGNQLAVSGRMSNASVGTVNGVVAVITARDTTGRFPATVEAPVHPESLAPGESGEFSMSVTLRERPDHYSVQFRLENGPFVPHKDERGLPFTIVPAPEEP